MGDGERSRVDLRDGERRRLELEDEGRRPLELEDEGRRPLELKDVEGWDGMGRGEDGADGERGGECSRRIDTDKRRYCI